MAQILHSGLTKAHIREHIIGLCKDAHEFSLLQNASAQDVQGVAFAIQCRRVAKDFGAGTSKIVRRTNKSRSQRY